MGTKVEGYWDCNQCGTKQIKGRFRNCTGCGKPRGKDVEFYMLETTAAENQNVSDEPDWYCSYCESLNSARISSCESCGASREESDKNYFNLQEEKKQEQREKEIKEQIRKEQLDDYKEFRSLNTETLYKKENKKEKHTNSKLLKKGIGFASIIALIGFLLVFLFVPKQTTLYVNNKTWQRSIEIEEYKTVRENAWNIPSGGRLVETKREIHHYDQIVDHYKTVTEQKSERYISHYKTETSYKDMGNGYFDTVTKQVPVYDTRYWTETKQEPVYKSVPVYQTKYYYDIERWVTKEWKTTEGINNEPYWHELDLQELEREGSRIEDYYISTTNKKDKEKRYELSYEEWEDILINTEIDVKLSMGQITEIVE